MRRLGRIVFGGPGKGSHEVQARVLMDVAFGGGVFQRRRRRRVRPTSNWF